MRASVFMAGQGFALSDDKERMTEGRRSSVVSALRSLSSDVRLPSSAIRSLPFGIPRLDTALGGGLRSAALHEIRSDESRNAGAVTGFAVAVLSRLLAANRNPILWIVESAAAHETGLPYAAGLARFGLPADRLIVVRVKKPVDALWVFEEGLRCSGIAAVAAEMRGNPPVLDLTASRRLALRAGETGVMGLLLRPSSRPEPGAAATRWLVSPRPAAVTDDYAAGIGDPAWRLALERNRYGTTGTFDVEWNHDRRTFAAPRAPAAAPAHPLPVAAVSFDRPPAPADVGQGVALKRAS